MRKKIIIVLGEPNSISSEIFLKSLDYIKKTKLNFIIIGNYPLLKKQAKYLKLKLDISFNFSNINKLNNHRFNFINVEYNQIKAFDFKSPKTDIFIKKCFECAIMIIKKKSSRRDY